MRSRIFPGAAALAALLAACGGSADGGAAADRPLALHPRPLFTAGSADGPAAFGRVTDVAFDEHENLYVLDGGAHRVVVFDSAGALVRRFGRQGGGPGELTAPAQLALAPGGLLVVSDPGRRSFSVFTRAGAYLRSLPFGERHGVPGLSMRGHPGAGVVTLGLPLALTPRAAQSPSRTVYLLRQPLGGAGAPEVLFQAASGAPRPRRGEPPPNPPAFAPGFRWAVLPSGELAVAHEAEYRVRVLAADGTPARAVGRALAPRPVTARDREAERARLRRQWSGARGTVQLVGGVAPAAPPPAVVEAMVARTRFAPVVPVIHRLDADGAGVLWVQREGGPGAEEAGPIDLLRADGTYLGTLAGQPMPDAFSPGGRAAYIEEDEAGVPRVRVARVRAGQQLLAEP